MRPEDEKYMRRCLQLAAAGRGFATPNPMVGSVIVAGNKVIGEGYHRQCGGPHAEVHAITSVKEDFLLKKATLYVNLEPCSHYGRTPPCAELIIKTGIPRVVVGCLDPFPPVSGRGVKMLRDAGVEVVTGCLEKEAWELNRIFITTHTLKRPYILLKWAQSADGFLDKIRESAVEPAVIFSTPITSQRVHKRRSEVEAILVGTRTALLDNPSLTVRSWCGNSPIRIVIDKDLSLPADSLLFDGKVKTLIFTNQQQKNENNIEYVQTDFSGKEIEFITETLYQHKISSLMVEGGSKLLQQFLDKGLWDEIQIENSPILLYSGIKAPVLPVLSPDSPCRMERSGLYLSYYRDLK